MKTFEDLTLNDKLYMTFSKTPLNILEIKHTKVGDKISTGLVLEYFKRWQTIDDSRKSKERLRIDDSNYISYSMVYIDKTERDQNQKKELVAQLNELKKGANEAIDRVVKFKAEHYDELFDLSDKEIMKRKRENLI